MKRFEELDFARVIPLLFLPLVHCFEQYGDFNLLSSSALTTGEFLMYICSMGPSVFMILLGMNIVFSKHNSYKELFKRGKFLIILFFIHNLIRYLIPGLIYYIFTGSDYIETAFIGVFVSDILLFAGLSLIFFSFMKKYKVSALNIFLISLFFLTIHTLIMPVDNPKTLLSVIIGCFVHDTEHSAFAFFSWIIFPSIGYLFGNYMLKYKDNLKDFYKKLFIISSALLFAVCSCLYKYNIDFLKISSSAANDNIANLFTVVLDTLLAFIWFSISYFLYNYLKKKLSVLFRKIIINTSKGILVFYLLQWVILIILISVLALFNLIKVGYMSFIMLLICSFIVLISSLLLTYLYLKKTDNLVTDIELKTWDK